jgi:serine-type D-Ala-D-Ala carboxypeptidase (penicillin-binding protein 5/6)
MRVAVLLAAGAIAAGTLSVTVAAAPARAAGLRPAAAVSGAAPARELVKRAALAPPVVASRLAELADAATGQNLWSRSSVTERPIGSITKVMTAYVVLSTPGVNLSRLVTVPSGITAYDKKYGASTAGLHPGEKLTTAQLLYAMLLPSGCDAAYALALAYGPGMSAFLAKMNETAKQLGMLHTHFTSPDGLPYPTEFSTFSTPADLVKLGMAAMRYPVFRSIVAQPFFQLHKGPGHHAYWWNNDNELIGTYPGATGIKTGFTNVALHCLLFSASRGGLNLIGVVLGSPATSPETGAVAATKILNWGFGLPRI